MEGKKCTNFSTGVIISTQTFVIKHKLMVIKTDMEKRKTLHGRGTSAAPFDRQLKLFMVFRKWLIAMLFTTCNCMQFYAFIFERYFDITTCLFLYVKFHTPSIPEVESRGSYF